MLEKIPDIHNVDCFRAPVAERNVFARPPAYQALPVEGVERNAAYIGNI